jgi:ribosomal protein L7/L12
MWKFTTLYHPLRHELGITVSEYIYLDYLAHTQAEPQNKHGNTEPLQTIADKLEVSKRHVINMNEKLIGLGLLEITGNKKEVTQRWFDGLKQQRGEKIAPPDMVKKVHQVGEKSSPKMVKKVHHHIKDIVNKDNILDSVQENQPQQPTPQQIDIAELNTQNAKAELIETLQAHSGSVFHELIRTARINASMKHKAWQWVLFELDKCINYYIGKDEQTRIGQKRALKATFQNWIIRAGQAGYDSFEYKPETQPKQIENKPDVIVKTKPYASKVNRP